jgi:signal-transduction protein with cAMP-binding, CBS, and nucleotidyltransferase domain
MIESGCVSTELQGEVYLKTFKDKESILVQSQRSSEFYVIKEGAVSVTQMMRNVPNTPTARTHTYTFSRCGYHKV